MPTHITRTRSVDAAQWDGTEQAANLIDSIVGMGRFRPFGEELLYVSEHSTRARLCPGDWVIRAADGHISRMDAETFAETYRGVLEPDCVTVTPQTALAHGHRYASAGSHPASWYVGDRLATLGRSGDVE